MVSWLSTLFSLTLLIVPHVAPVTATPQLSPLVLHEKRRQVPGGWERSHKHASHNILPMRFGLTQSNLDRMDDFINEVAHPESSNYGKHWTMAEVAAKFAPSSESIGTVKEWLVANGIEEERIRLSSARVWIDVNATVAEAEKLLNTEYHVFKHESGKQHVSCDSYHVPAHVQPHIDIITPTVHFNAVLGKRSVTHEVISLEKRKSTTKETKKTSDKSTKPATKDTKKKGPKSTKLNPGSSGHSHLVGPHGGMIGGPSTTGVNYNKYHDLAHCDSQITPDCLRALYGINNYTAKSSANNSYAIVEYTPQAYVPSDLDLFAEFYEPDNSGERPILRSIDGGVVQTTQTSFDINGESNLDLQYGMALVTAAQPVQLYQVGDTTEGASFGDLLDALDGSYCTYEGGDDPNQDGIYPDPYGGYQGPKACGTVAPAKVISTSYTYNEADLTPFYTARQCNEYAKLGLLGVTVLYSSGDNGVAGNGQLCLNPDGTQSTHGERFNPSFPGTCPYITSVGATIVHAGHTVLEPESACDSVIYSGGGFSNYFAMPAYQQTQVTNYLTNHSPAYPAGTYNTSSSRGFPDLAANGANYVVANNGDFYSVYGTSASTPVVGAILTMINDARIAAGKSGIGFINPTIYSTTFANAFNDVTNGTNPGCGTVGFNTSKGWDPVTGLGTPNFPKLVNKWLALP